MRSVSDHYSLAVSDDFEEALKRLLDAKIRRIDYSPAKFAWARRLRLPSLERRLRHAGLARNVFVCAMWLDKQYRYLLQDARRRKWVYLFDTWEPHWDYIEGEARCWRNVAEVYFSSLQTAEYMRGRLDIPVSWLPQASGIAATQCWRQQAKEPIVYNIGRPNSVLEAFFRDWCARRGFRYVTQGPVDAALLSSREAFEALLGRARVVVVHPRNIDSPEVTGSVSMITARFYEAYRCGAVVCGFKPSSGEFERVFAGYPFVEYRSPVQFSEALEEALADERPWQHAREHALMNHNWTARLGPVASDIREYLGNAERSVIS